MFIDPTGALDGVPFTPPELDTIEYLYVYPNGFFPERRDEPDIGDVVVDSGLNPSGVTSSDVLATAAEDGDDLIILKVTRAAGFIAKVEFVAAVSGPGLDA